MNEIVDYPQLSGAKIAENADLPDRADNVGTAILESLPRWPDKWAPDEKSGRRWQYTWATVNTPWPGKPRGTEVLDAGADNVSLQYFFANCGAYVTSMDNNGGALVLARAEAKAQGLADRMAFVLHDLLDPLREIYDIVLCLSVLEHIGHWQTAARNLARAVRIDGSLIITVDVAMPEATLPYFRPPQLLELADVVEAEGFTLIGDRDALRDYPADVLVNMLGQNQDQPLTWAGLPFRRDAQ